VNTASDKGVRHLYWPMQRCTNG